MRRMSYIESECRYEFYAAALDFYSEQEAGDDWVYEPSILQNAINLDHVLNRLASGVDY